MHRLFSLSQLPLLALSLFAGASLFVAQAFPSLPSVYRLPSNTPFYIALPMLTGLLAWVAWLRYQPSQRATVRATFIALFPTALVLAVGVSASTAFHYLIHLAVGLYVIAAFIAWARTFIEDNRENTASHAPLAILAPFSWKSDNRRSLLLVLLLTLTFLGFGMHNLTRFAAVDEPLWLDGRIGKFWKYLAEERMDKTLISDKPGITVVWAAGPALFSVQPKDYRETRYDYQAKNPALNIEYFYRAFRLPLLLVITACLPLFYLLLVPLVGRTAALFAYAGIVLAPIPIGMSKIVNPDALLWIFAPLACLAYLVFFERRQWRFLILSGFLLGLALLTKYVANILIVFFFGLIFLSSLWRAKTTPNELFRSLQAFLLWLGVGLATLYLAVPAFWVQPARLLTSTLWSQAFEKVSWFFIAILTLVFFDQLALKSRGSTWILAIIERLGRSIVLCLLGFFTFSVLLTVINTLAGMPLIDFVGMLMSPKSASKLHGFLAAFFTHFYPLLFGSTPLILLGTGIMLWRAGRSERSVYGPAERLTVALVAFILLYYVGSTVNGVTLINRYQIMLYPLLAILGGLGLHALTVMLGRIRGRLGQTAQSSGVLLAGITSLFLALTPATTPFPLSYASVLLPKRFAVDVKDMGAGSYEAAQYLNQLPDAQTTAIWTDKGGVCKFYVGPCLDSFSLRKLKEQHVRYIVISLGRESRTQNRFTPNTEVLSKDDDLFHLNAYYYRNDPLYAIHINGRPSQYVKIFPITP